MSNRVRNRFQPDSTHHRLPEGREASTSYAPAVTTSHLAGLVLHDGFVVQEGLANRRATVGTMIQGFMSHRRRVHEPDVYDSVAMLTATNWDDRRVVRQVNEQLRTAPATSRVASRSPNVPLEDTVRQTPSQPYVAAYARRHTAPPMQYHTPQVGKPTSVRQLPQRGSAGRQQPESWSGLPPLSGYPLPRTNHRLQPQPQPSRHDMAGSPLSVGRHAAFDPPLWLHPLLTINPPVVPLPTPQPPRGRLPSAVMQRVIPPESTVYQPPRRPGIIRLCDMSPERHDRSAQPMRLPTLLSPPAERDSTIPPFAYLARDTTPATAPLPAVVLEPTVAPDDGQQSLKDAISMFMISLDAHAATA